MKKESIKYVFVEGKSAPLGLGISAVGQSPHNGGMNGKTLRAGWAGLLGLGLLGQAAAAPPAIGPVAPSLPSGAPLVFWQTLTGMLPGKTKQQRFTLRFDGGQPRLTVQARTCPGPSLKGGPTPVCTQALGKPLVSYAGKLRPRLYGVEIWLSTEAVVEGFPAEMTLTCLRSVVGVLPAGASLQSGDACAGDGPPPRWLPGKTQDVGLWLCHLHDEPGAPWTGYGSLGPLAFAAGGGVEWVYVNNDCAGQEGAFRLPAAGP